MSGEFQVVFVTCKDSQEGESIANALIKEKLAACVNILPIQKSIYRWQGKIKQHPEALLIIKTRTEHFESLKDRIRELHSYTVPEVISLDIQRGNQAYLDWIHESTSLN